MPCSSSEDRWLCGLCIKPTARRNLRGILALPNVVFPNRAIHVPCLISRVVAVFGLGIGMELGKTKSF